MISRHRPVRFQNRQDAGEQLAVRLRDANLHAPLVLALPRGGVPIGYELAMDLDAPLDVFVARKIGAPGHRELGIGAIAEGGDVVADAEALRMLGVSSTRFDQLADAERVELSRRVRLYRGERPLPDLAKCDVVLADDGLATGITAEAALRSLRGRGARRLLLAVPAAAPESVARLTGLADEVVCVIAPADFVAVGKWYDDFDQTSDEEVLRLLAAAGQPRTAAAKRSNSPGMSGPAG